MKYLIRHARLLFISAISLLTLGCSGVKTTINNQYILNAYSSTHRHKSPSSVSLRVSLPEASAGYQTEQMLYIDTPYQLRVFSKNAWVNPPAEMLQPLLIQSLQKTKAFYAITSSTYNEAADYRLDTLLFNLHQNFLKKPSVLEFSAKVLLTRVRDNHVIASKTLSYSIPCPYDNPMGGVVAANKATLLFTAQVNTFVISHLDP